MALYNPNKAVQGIADYKAKWANAKAKGEDTAAYEQGAKAYYEELRNNGRGDIADHLEKSDAVQAGEYLKTLTSDYQATAGDLQSKSNEAYKWTTDTANQLGNDYDMVFQTIGVTPTRTDYGKDILGGYGLAAEGAYKGTLGGASSDNGGNVDSFAAAQANRNKAAMVKEGYGTVLDYYNSIAGNATNWANSKANALGGFAGLMQGNITDDRDMVKTAFNGTVDLEKTRMQTDAEKYGYDTGLEGTKYKTDAEERVQEGLNEVEKYLGELDYSGKVYTSQLGAASSTATDTLGNQTFFGMNNVPAPTIYTKDANGNMVTIVPGANTATSGTAGASDTGTGTGTATATATNGASVVDIPGLTQGKNVYFLSQNGGYTDANGNPVDTFTVMNDGNRVLLVNRGSGAPSLTYDNSKGTTVYVLDPVTGEYYNQSHTVSYPASTVNADPNAIIVIGDNIHRTSAVTPIHDGNTDGNSYGTGTGNTDGNTAGTKVSGDGTGNIIDKLAASANGDAFKWTNEDQAMLNSTDVNDSNYNKLKLMLNGITGAQRDTIIDGFVALGLDSGVANTLR